MAEGNVGGGTGMICFDLMCGTGTASRIISIAESSFTIGVLVQANFGDRDELLVAGVPVGQVLRDDMVHLGDPAKTDPVGSIIIIVATDAPLLPHQLKRLARRAAMGLARTGSYASNSSGDIFIAFSTANEGANQADSGVQLDSMANENISRLFLATIQATEEAIINVLVAGREMRGHRGHVVEAIDHDRLRSILRDHDRLVE